MTEFEKARLEIAAFMRGHYRLDEVPGMFYATPCLKFRQGKKTIVSINLHEEHFEFQIILGKAEREKFEAIRSEFPADIQAHYDQQPSLHDGKWLFIKVSSPKEFEPVKKLILLKKKPNRKPFSKEHEHLGSCGHRCDLCVHYTGITEEFRSMLIPHLNAVYGISDWGMRCTGCRTDGCQCYQQGSELCEPLKCLPSKAADSCMACAQYPCELSTVGYRQLEHRGLSADDITWGILPYVPFQYEK